MHELPKEPGLIRERIRRYQRKLRAEKARWGRIHDGAGKRYLPGPLFLLLGDLENALGCFHWFEAEFPEDCSEPGHHLCWALALYRGGDHEAAARKLRQTMLMNLYLIPYLLGQKVARIEMWHGSSDAEPGYLEQIPPEFFSLWDKKARLWAAQLYHSEPVRAVISRYIEIHRELLSMPPGPQRTRLVSETFSLTKQWTSCDPRRNRSRFHAMGYGETSHSPNPDNFARGDRFAKNCTWDHGLAIKCRLIGENASKLT